MTDERVLVKKVVLLALQEKREAKRKELAALEQDPKVRAYTELKAGLALLDEAVRDSERQVAHAQVGFQPQADKPVKPLKGRAASYMLHHTGGELLAKIQGSHVYQVPYANMLAEFRGQENVPRAKILHWFVKTYGVSSNTADPYIVHALSRATMKPNRGRQGTLKTYGFPSRYDTVAADEPKPDLEEVRKAGLV